MLDLMVEHNTDKPYDCAEKVTSSEKLDSRMIQVAMATANAQHPNSCYGSALISLALQTKITLLNARD